MAKRNGSPSGNDLLESIGNGQRDEGIVLFCATVAEAREVHGQDATTIDDVAEFGAWSKEDAKLMRAAVYAQVSADLRKLSEQRAADRQVLTAGKIAGRDIDDAMRVDVQEGLNALETDIAKLSAVKDGLGGLNDAEAHRGRKSELTGRVSMWKRAALVVRKHDPAVQS